MSQLTIYMPEALSAEVKRRAKLRKQSVSAYLASLVQRDASTEAWSKEFVRSFGSCAGAKLEPPEELAFERRTRLR